MKIYATLLLLLAFNSSFAFADGNRCSKILTADIATKLLGEPTHPSIKNSMNDTEIGKVWVSSAGFETTGNAKSCGLMIRHATNKDEAVDKFHESKKLFNGVGVTGFGDEAYRIDKPSPQFNVLKGQNWIIIRAGNFKVADTSAQEKLATELLPKIDAN